MLGAGTFGWTLLERRRATAFLVAGGLLVASPGTKALALFADVTPPAWLVVLLVFPGLLASLAGLLGLYPGLADRVPRLALAGGGVVAISGVGLTMTFGWLLAASVLPAVAGIAIAPPPGVVFPSLVSLLATAFVVFGVASVGAGVPSRSVGLLLLGFAVPWVVLLAVTPVYGTAIPGWLALSVYGVLPVVLLVTGYRLRGGSTRTEPGELPSGSVAG